LDAQVDDGDAGFPFANGSQALQQALDSVRWALADAALTGRNWRPGSNTDRIQRRIAVRPAPEQNLKDVSDPEVLVGNRTDAGPWRCRPDNRPMLGVLIPTIYALADHHSSAATAQAACLCKQG